MGPFLLLPIDFFYETINLSENFTFIFVVEKKRRVFA